MQCQFKVSYYISIIIKHKAADDSFERIPRAHKSAGDNSFARIPREGNTITINTQQSDLTMFIIPLADQGSTRLLITVFSMYFFFTDLQ